MSDIGSNVQFFIFFIIIIKDKTWKCNSMSKMSQTQEYVSPEYSAPTDIPNITVPTEYVHKHYHIISFKSFFSQFLPAFLFGISLFGMMKTDGRFMEINYSMVGFAGLSILKSFV